jgi:hypothetical protein
MEVSVQRRAAAASRPANSDIKTESSIIILSMENYIVSAQNCSLK